MSRESGRKYTSDRQKIIEWYREDVQRYRRMIGKETEYGTIVTERLIRNIENRIKELEIKEKLDDTRRELS